MNKDPKKPRILVVTPEITYLPPGMGNLANLLSAKAGGLADVSASLVSSLYELGADVHVALPHYRKQFLHVDVERLLDDELLLYKRCLQQDRIHLAEDSAFYHRDSVYSSTHLDSMKLAIAFQREVLNNIILKVNPDLIHCNDWMTGLIPAAARRMGIPTLFTVHNIHTNLLPTGMIEDRGIDVSEFWKHLYYDGMPTNYPHARSMKVDLMTSGIIASHFINTVSPTFLREIVDGWFDFIPHSVRREIINKYHAGCATGILNAPDPSYDPATDTALKATYSSTTPDLAGAKRKNKLEFQRRVGLQQNVAAPLFFWPSRLDPMQKGCPLLAEILYHVVSAFWEEGLQIAVVANGPYQRVFANIADFHNMRSRIAVVDFDENLSRLGYAASDFMLMPSMFEPCGLPQMISPLYGSLPVAHDTGGLHDTVFPLDLVAGKGNGFPFGVYDTGGLWWAMGKAMEFYRQPVAVRETQLRRIMDETRNTFNHAATAKAYIDLYEKMLNRPLVVDGLH